MPRRMTATKDGAHKVLKNTSFESIVASWLMRDGWQVFLPILDHGHKTDILISDGPNYYRIQVKTVDGATEDLVIENKWEEGNVDVVVFFARNSNWGYIAPGFKEQRRPLNHESHRRFEQGQKKFLKEFHQL
ncbi:MAG: hypothetical protein CL923_11925 [Deltaproteobacteria bacterium]|nr:hypothetical protein [Deltaproteobacteria bacterium]